MQYPVSSCLMSIMIAYVLAAPNVKLTKIWGHNSMNTPDAIWLAKLELLYHIFTVNDS